MNDRTRPLAEALTSTNPCISALALEIEALVPGAGDRLTAALWTQKIAPARPN